MMRDHEQEPLTSPAPDHSEEIISPALSMRRRRRRGRPGSSGDREAFVRLLHAKMQHKLASHVDDDAQVEIANLMRLLATMSWDTVDEHRAYFELASDLLAAQQPNMILVRSIRFDLAEIKERNSGWISRALSYFCGDTPLHAVLSGLLMVVVFSFFVALILAEGHRLASVAANELSYEFPLFVAVRDIPIIQLILLVHAAFIGSVVSIAVRIRDFLSIAAFSSLLVFVSVVTRPFISIMFAILAFVMIKAGVISFLGVDLDSPSGSYLSWALGFLCGFSERLAQDFVGRAGGVFGDSAATTGTKEPR